MKHIGKSYALLLASVLFLASCSLDIDLIGNITEIDSQEDVEDLVGGAYASMTESAYYKEHWVVALSLSADDLRPNEAPSGIYSLFGHKQYNAATAYVESAWTAIYRAINCCNLALHYIDTEPELFTDEALKIRIEGEARFLRALNYFNLVRLWGPVPFSLKPTLSEKDFNKKRESLETIYEAIVTDLTTASGLLLSKEQTQEGRPDEMAAKALLSLVYLTMEDWENAYAMADEVIESGQYDLVSDYADLWNVKKEDVAAKEVIFAVKFTTDMNDSSSGGTGSSLPPLFCPGQYGLTGQPASDGRAKGRGLGYIRVQQWFYDRCMAATGTTVSQPDYRIETSFFGSYISMDTGNPVKIYPTPGYSSQKWPYVKKYVDPDGKNARNHENDFILLRLSEVYLIKAEAANELRDVDAKYVDHAYDAFNALRARARKADGKLRSYPSDLAPGLSKDDFRMAVFDERGLEFVGEAKRWFDLVRMKVDDSGKTMYDYFLGEYIPSQQWNNDKAYKDGLAYSPHRKLFPIPSSEIATNHIEQNSGY